LINFEETNWVGKASVWCVARVCAARLASRLCSMLQSPRTEEWRSLSRRQAHNAGDYTLGGNMHRQAKRNRPAAVASDLTAATVAPSETLRARYRQRLAEPDLPEHRRELYRQRLQLLEQRLQRLREEP
jgi:hypothetical protein